ncbi:hypothetical protein BT96DRAFT_920195 [Gymnopus androsaceus JB14]|uniref:Uncharacterized protein n=1 Tax=Gymnopus androsaceus JB14 TaxID=1447944 RepID=A0A6A4HR15_9AGAR|nr:hypothetical protein BT96DRAFT_920195 [Gymnopus androsaceus JB14]
MNSQQSTSSAESVYPYPSTHAKDDSSSQLGSNKKYIWQLPYFPPLNVDDEFEIHDFELVHDNEKKQTDILVRVRVHSSARPAYKIEKKTRVHLLQGGKKHINMLISKSEAWDSIAAKPQQSQSKMGKGYIILFQAMDQSPRHLSLSPTKGMVLYLTARGGDLTLTPNCASYDPQRSRALQPRIDLLSTLYCTGYERRFSPRKGDVVLAELRLSRPADPTSTEGPSAWKRFFKERHVSLFISKRGMETVFTGPHVNMHVRNPKEGERYTLTSGQAQEIIISLFATSLMVIEHDGLESKKWAWLTNREILESSLGGPMTSIGVPGSNSSTGGPSMLEKYPHGFENMSISDTSSMNKSGGLKPDTSFEKWKVVSYESSMGEAVLRANGRGGGGGGGHGNAPSTAGLTDSMTSTNEMETSSDKPSISAPLQTMEVTEGSTPVSPTVEPTQTQDLPKKWPTEGPKVTGKPKPGVEGGIYW